MMHPRCTLLFPAEQQPEAAARKTTAGHGQGRAASRRTIDYSNRLTAEAVGKPRRRQPRVPEAPWVKSLRARLHRAPPSGSVPYRYSAAHWGHPVFMPA